MVAVGQFTYIQILRTRWLAVVVMSWLLLTPTFALAQDAYFRISSAINMRDQDMAVLGSLQSGSVIKIPAAYVVRNESGGISFTASVNKWKSAIQSGSGGGASLRSYNGGKAYFYPVETFGAADGGRVNPIGTRYIALSSLTSRGKTTPVKGVVYGSGRRQGQSYGSTPPSIRAQVSNFISTRARGATRGSRVAAAPTSGRSGSLNTSTRVRTGVAHDGMAAGFRTGTASTTRWNRSAQGSPPNVVNRRNMWTPSPARKVLGGPVYFQLPGNERRTLVPSNRQRNFQVHGANYRYRARLEAGEVCLECDRARQGNDQSGTLRGIAEVGSGSQNRLPINSIAQGVSSIGMCSELVQENGFLGPKGQFMYNHIMSNSNYVEDYINDPHALGSFCPKFATLNAEERGQAWVYFFMALAVPESTCSETVLHKSSKTPGIGLWAMEISPTKRSYRPDCQGSPNTFEGQARCAIGTMWDIQLDEGYTASSYKAADGTYWEPIKNKRGALIGRMKGFSKCF